MRRYSIAVLLISVLASGLIAPSLAVAAGCQDYLTQKEAQDRLRADPTDPEGLDPDGNGIACERNPQPYDTTPVVRPGFTTPTATPQPATPTPTAEPAPPTQPAPSQPQAPEPTATPVPRSPLLGPPPPPLQYLQGGQQLFQKSSTPTPGGTPATAGTLYVQGADTTIGPVVMQRALGIIQPPNTGDGGLLRE